MTKHVSEPYCEGCGINVTIGADLKRFGKLFCSSEPTRQQYIRARQRGDLGINGTRKIRRLLLG